MTDFNLLQPALRGSGVPVAKKPVQLVRMVECVINSTGRVTARRDTWEDSVKAVSRSKHQSA